MSTVKVPPTHALRPRHSLRAASDAAPLLVAALFSGVQGAQMVGALPSRVALAAGLLFLAASVARLLLAPAGRTGVLTWRSPWLIAALLFVPATFALQVVLGLQPAPFYVAAALGVWSQGWALYFLSVPPLSAQREAGPSRRWHLPPVATLPLVGAFAFAVLALAQWLESGTSPVVIDETLYFVQARMFRHGELVRSLDPALQRFFMPRQSVFLHGLWFSQYPPGWPALLAVFDAIHAGWIAAGVLSALTVALTFALGRRLGSPTVGLLAAALLLFQPSYLVFANGYWSHAACALALVLAAHLVILEPPRAPVPWWRWLAGGAAVAVAFSIRPLTGLTVGISLALWYCLRARPGLAAVGRGVAWAAAGALLPIALTLAYNIATTGRATHFGYVAANGQLQTLGLGPRGFVPPQGGGPPPAVGAPVTRAVTFGGAAELAGMAALSLLPLGLLLPVLVVGARRSGRIWSVAAAFALLPVSQALFFSGAGLRLNLELLPFVCLGIALLLARLWSSSRPDLARPTALLLAVALPVLAAATVQVKRGTTGRCRSAEAAVRARARETRLLLFVPRPPRNGAEPLFECLWKWNADGFDGPVVVARDVGADDSILVRRYPGRPAFVLHWDIAAKRPAFVPAPATASSDGRPGYAPDAAGAR